MSRGFDPFGFAMPPTNGIGQGYANGLVEQGYQNLQMNNAMEVLARQQNSIARQQLQDQYVTDLMRGSVQGLPSPTEFYRKKKVLLLCR